LIVEREPSRRVPFMLFKSRAVTHAIAVAARYAWASPATLLGVLLAGAALCAGARARVAHGALEVAGGRVGPVLARLPRRMQFAAITLGHVIVGVDHDVLGLVRAHEQAHVRQYERLGILFFPLYLGSSLLALLGGRDPYLDNRFEREARLLARRSA
jgi:hypothetical protein